MRRSRGRLILIALIVVLIALAALMPLVTHAPVRTLLVASDVLADAGGPARFATYLAERVNVIPYDYERVATYAELAELVRKDPTRGPVRPVRPIRSVGLMYHTRRRNSLQCFARDPAKSTVSSSPETFESFRAFVITLRAAHGVEDVDLISCGVVSGSGTSVLASLDYGGARVNASTNTTGQSTRGPIGDWVLEMGDVRLIGRYFNETIATSGLVLAPTMPVFYVCRLVGPRDRNRESRERRERGALLVYKGNETTDIVSDRTARGVLSRLGPPHGEFRALAQGAVAHTVGAYGAYDIESYDRLFARAEMTVSDSDGDTVGDKGDSFSQFPMIEPYCFLVVSYNIQNDGGVVTGSFVSLDVMSLDHSPSSDKKREYDRLADEWQEQLRILGPGLEKRIAFARAKLKAVQSEL